jgi:hypothetical protein
MFIINPYSHAPGTLNASIQRLGLTSGLQNCYDAGDISSWPGSGEYWEDVSGNNIDAINGISAANATNNFTYAGTAGNQTASEYWSYTAAPSVFRIQIQTWMKSVHKNGGKCTYVGWANNVSSYSAFGIDTIDSRGLYGTAYTYPGFAIGVGDGSGGSTLGAITVDVRRADGNIAAQVFGTTVVPSGWTFTAVSLDEDAGTYVIQVNGSQQTGALSYSTPATTDGTVDMTISRSSPPSSYYINSLALWSAGLSAANLLLLYNLTKSKFGL